MVPYWSGPLWLPNGSCVPALQWVAEAHTPCSPSRGWLRIRTGRHNTGVAELVATERFQSSTLSNCSEDSLPPAPATKLTGITQPAVRAFVSSELLPMLPQEDRSLGIKPSSRLAGTQPPSRSRTGLYALNIGCVVHERSNADGRCAVHGNQDYSGSTCCENFSCDISAARRSMNSSTTHRVR